MIGDLFSSFCKRRFGLPSSSRARGLDQIPEALLPLLACRDLLILTGGDIVLCVVVFVVGEVVLRACSMLSDSVIALIEVNAAIELQRKNAGALNAASGRRSLRQPAH
jgi:hypothetical protein